MGSRATGSDFRDYVKDTDYHRRSKSTVAVISPLGEHIVVRVHAQNADVRKAVCGLCFEHCFGVCNVLSTLLTAW